MKGITMLQRLARRNAARRTSASEGQILALFALSLVAMVAMVGLVLDGGSTFAQRRNQQNAADMAAIAGANQFLLSGSKAAATTTAQAIASQNGFVNDPTAGKTVTVSFQDNDTHVKVDVSAPHHNNFTGVVGLTQWQVSTTATVETGIPDTAKGGAPFIFNKDVFTDPGGNPILKYSNPSAPFTFGDSNGDVPNDPGDIAWTCYGTCDNVDSNTVRKMIDGTSPVSVTLDPTKDFNTYIGQHNNGNHTTLFGEVRDVLIEEDVPVPVVDDNGLFQGWAVFHITGANQGGKTITGYFKSPFNQSDALEVKGCSGSCPKPRYLGVYVLQLVN